MAEKIMPKGMYGSPRCGKCGGAVDTPDRFCRWCGEPLKERMKPDYAYIKSEK